MRVVLGITFIPIASWLCWQAHDLFSGHGSGVLYLGWFGTLLIAGFVSGLAWPKAAIWGAVLITCGQSVFVYELLDSIGELQNPSRSTGGLVEWGIVTGFLVAFSPFPALASWLGCRLSRRWKPAQPAAAAAGAKPPPLSG
jgi:hypothetical protein